MRSIGTEGEAIGVGAAFLVDGFAYALVAVAAAVQLVRNCCRYRPWTVQKMIHLLMFSATLSTDSAHGLDAGHAISYWRCVWSGLSSLTFVLFCHASSGCFPGFGGLRLVRRSHG